MKKKPIPMDLRRQVIIRDKWKCQYCGKLADIGYYNRFGYYQVAEKNTDFIGWGRIWDRHYGPYISFEIDHIVPESKNGDMKIDNLTLACRACNRRKGVE